MLNLFVKQSVSLSLSLCTCMFVSECSCLSLFGGTLASPFLFYTIGVETLFCVVVGCYGGYSDHFIVKKRN